MSDLFGVVKPEHAIPGFGGALAYLFFVKELKPLGALLILTAGLTTAAFLTPMTVSALKRFAQWDLAVPEQFGLAFLLGFTAMVGLLPFALAVATWFNRNADALMARLTGSQPPNGGDDAPHP